MRQFAEAGIGQERRSVKGGEAGRISKHQAMGCPGGGPRRVAGRSLMEESTATPLTHCLVRSFQNECADLDQL